MSRQKRPNGPKRPHFDGGIPPWAHRMREEMVDALVAESYPVALVDLASLSVLVLADKFGWGRDLITVYMNELMVKMQALQEGEISLPDAHEAIWDDYGIRLDYDTTTKSLSIRTGSDERA